MRLKVEITDLTPEQWEQAQNILKTGYTIPDGASQVCLTLVHGNEERHVETPVGALTGLLTGLNLGQAIKTAMAALTPDDPALPKVKNTGNATDNGPGSFANTGYVGKRPDA